MSEASHKSLKKHHTPTALSNSSATKVFHRYQRNSLSHWWLAIHKLLLTRLPYHSCYFYSNSPYTGHLVNSISTIIDNSKYWNYFIHMFLFTNSHFSRGLCLLSLSSNWKSALQLTFWESHRERNWEDATYAIKGDNTFINSPDKIDGILNQSKPGTSSWHVPFPLYNTLGAFLSPSRRSV